jgi:hypothetical protein
VCVPLTVVSTAGAKAKPPTTAAKEKRQNDRITDTRVKVATNTLSIGSLKTAGTALANSLTSTNGALGTIATLAAGLPPILTQLADGLGALKTLATANEYGVVMVAVNGTPSAGAILVSSDIPDDSNSAVVSGTMIVPVPNGANTLTLLGGVRSNEADGNGAADPVASAGIVSMEATAITGLGVTIGGGNTGLPSAVPITSAPNPAAGGAPVYAIPDKAPRVDETPNPFAFPIAKTIDLTAPASLQNLGGGVGPFTATNAGPNPAPVIVRVTVRFNDLTASASAVDA